MIVGKIGGRRLPLVAADLLKYRLGAQALRGAGPSQLVTKRAGRAGAAGERSGPGPADV